MYFFFIHSFVSPQNGSKNRIEIYFNDFFQTNYFHIYWGDFSPDLQDW